MTGLFRNHPVGATRGNIRGVACVLLVVGLSACGSGGASNGTTSSSATSTPAAGHMVAQVPAGQLTTKGKLLVCADFPAPPQEMYNAQSQPIGSDVDTGNAIGNELGLKTQWVNTVFDTIIEAVSTGKCDIAMSGIFITPARQKQVDMIPYFSAGESLLVKKGDPAHLGDASTHPMTLCGKTIALQLGSAETDQAKAWSQQCTKQGKPAINFLVSAKVNDALEQVLTGRAVTFFFDSPTNGYYAKLHPDEFQIQGQIINNIQEGIVVAKGKKGLSTAVKTAMRRLETNGAYAKILKKWGEAGATIPTIS